MIVWPGGVSLASDSAFSLAHHSSGLLIMIAHLQRESVG